LAGWVVIEGATGDALDEPANTVSDTGIARGELLTPDAATNT
jgi:hypothetical protein